MDLSGHIRDLIVIAKEMRSAPGVNKQWANKTIARLEEAEVFAGKIIEGRVNGVPTGQTPVTGSGIGQQACTCPPGAVDNDCPVHGLAIPAPQ